MGVILGHSYHGTFLKAYCFEVLNWKMGKEEEKRLCERIKSKIRSANARMYWRGMDNVDIFTIRVCTGPW